MAEEKKLNNIQQIVQHSINKEPSKVKNLVGKEIASRIMTHIDNKRAQIGKTLFSH